MKKSELLCPVGGYDTLQAALLGGADAVYFGTKDFNARMNAKNFTREETLAAIKLCHEKGVRAYITMNTLLTDRALSSALENVSFLYEAGCDALILADVGLSSLIKEYFPDMELHASTQMSGHSLGTASFLKEKGFSRMVLAREMDRENIRTLCQNSPIETEVFVHGAICASASGQCLMSSMIGDRSGNRGECAQPCRLPYNGTYPLSFKDLSLASHINEILDLGIHSLKIEGRMKSPEYVYTVSRTWRTLLDEERCATKKELDALAGVFSRSGFTDGYFVKDISPNMLGTRTNADKDKTRQQKIRFTDSGRNAPPILLKREKITPPEITLPKKTKPHFHRSARFLFPEAIPETDLFSEIYLPLERFDGKKANGVIMPSAIFPDEEEQTVTLLKNARENGARHLLIGNIGHLPLVKDMDFILHGDFRLNITNSLSLSSYPDFVDIIVSPELNSSQIRDLRGNKSTIVYGRIPLMLLEKDPGFKKLQDRKGITFPVIKEKSRYLVINSVPFYMLDKKKFLKEKGIENIHFFFTTETKKEVSDIIRAFREGSPAKIAVKRIK